MKFGWPLRKIRKSWALARYFPGGCEARGRVTLSRTGPFRQRRRPRNLRKTSEYDLTAYLE